MTSPIQFKIWCKEEGADDSTAWSEPYTQITTNPQKWAEKTIAKFNATCRPGEKHRVLLRVEVTANKTKLKHDWRKTNLVTVTGRGGMHDTYRCAQCNKTGKRFGLDDGVTPDKGTPEWCKNGEGP